MRVVAVLLKKKLCIHIGSGYEICLRHCTLYPHSCGCVRYVFEGAMMCVCVCSWVHYVNWCMHCYAWFDADWVWKFNRAIFARVCVFVFVFVCSLVCWASAYFFFSVSVFVVTEFCIWWWHNTFYRELWKNAYRTLVGCCKSAIFDISLFVLHQCTSFDDNKSTSEKKKNNNFNVIPAKYSLNFQWTLWSCR